MQRYKPHFIAAQPKRVDVREEHNFPCSFLFLRLSRPGSIAIHLPQTISTFAGVHRSVASVTISRVIRCEARLECAGQQQHFPNSLFNSSSSPFQRVSVSFPHHRPSRTHSCPTRVGVAVAGFRLAGDRAANNCHLGSTAHLLDRGNGQTPTCSCEYRLCTMQCYVLTRCDAGNRPTVGISIQIRLMVRISTFRIHLMVMIDALFCESN
jgi:hypothetical protein